MFDHDDGRLRLPNPDDTRSGYVRPSAFDNSPSSYGFATAPEMAPAGKVFIPEINSYVDSDVAATLGFGAMPQDGQEAPEVPHALDPSALGQPRGDEIDLDALEDMTEEELEALQEQLEVQEDDREPSLSPTLDDIADCFGSDFDAAVDQLVVGTPEDTLATLSAATGLDPISAATLIEATVNEAAPLGTEHIGSDRWQALVYAAAATDDQFAKRVLSDFVRGKLHPTRLMEAYGCWYNSLPDAED